MGSTQPVIWLYDVFCGSGGVLSKPKKTTSFVYLGLDKEKRKEANEFRQVRK